MSDLTQARWNTFQRQEPEHKILVNYIRYKTHIFLFSYKYFKTQVPHVLPSQSEILLDPVLYLRHKFRFSIAKQNTFLSRDSHFELQYVSFNASSENLVVHQNNISCCWSSLFSSPCRLTKHWFVSTDEIGLIVDLGAEVLNQVCLLQFKLRRNWDTFPLIIHQKGTTVENYPVIVIPTEDSQDTLSCMATTLTTKQRQWAQLNLRKCKQ